MKISSVYPREVDMIKMTLNSARESCTLLPSAAAMCGEIFSSGGRGGGGGGGVGHSKYHIPTDDLKLFINQEQPRRYVCMSWLLQDYQPLLDCLGCSKLLQTAVSAGAVVHKLLQISETNCRENTM